MTSKYQTVTIGGNARVVTTTTLDGVVTTNESSELVSSNFLNSSNGIDNPMWKDQVRKHANATTPYSASKARLQVSPGSADIALVIVPDVWYRSWTMSGWLLQSFNMADPGPSDGLLNATYLAFVRKANQELRSIQGMQALGELREAVHMIRHPLESLKNGLVSYLAASVLNSKKALRGSTSRRLRAPTLGRNINDTLRDRGVLTLRQGKRRVKLPKKQQSRGQAIADAISGTYLEYANGWRPFISDIQSASKALAEHFTPSGIGYRSVSATAQGEDTHELSTQLGGYSVFTWNQQNLIVRKSSGKMVGEVVVSSMGNTADLGRNAGFSLAGFVPTIWELLPLSYVADYFVNMGQTLEAMAFNRANVAWFSRTIRSEATSTSTGQIIPPDPGSTYSSYGGSPGSVVFKRTDIVRDALEDWMPSLVFSLPGSHLLSKLANTTSLLAQAKVSSRQISRLLNG